MGIRASRVGRGASVIDSRSSTWIGNHSSVGKGRRAGAARPCRSPAVVFAGARVKTTAHQPGVDCPLARTSQTSLSYALKRAAANDVYYLRIRLGTDMQLADHFLKQSCAFHCGRRRQHPYVSPIIAPTDQFHSGQIVVQSVEERLVVNYREPVPVPLNSARTCQFDVGVMKCSTARKRHV